MSLKSRFAGFAPWAAVVILWGSANILASGKDLRQVRSHDAVLKQLFGSSTIAIANVMFSKADSFYHAGREIYREKGFTDDLFQNIRAELVPSGHVHLHGDDLKEVMAWTKFAMSLDPLNAEYALTTSYWLGRELGRPDLAFEALNEAQMNNPVSHEIQMGLGRLYAKGGDRARTEMAYQRALRLWPGRLAPDDEEAKTHMREILSRLEVLRELDGDSQGAVFYLNMLTDLFPDRKGMFRDRKNALLEGRQPAESAEDRWNSLRRIEFYHFCDADTDHDHSAHAEGEGHVHDEHCGHDH